MPTTPDRYAERVGRFNRQREPLDATETEAVERSVLNALSGGQTRSKVELVTDLAIAYEELATVVRRLLDASFVRVDHKSDDEVFYALDDRGLKALQDGDGRDLKSLATDPTPTPS